MRFTSNFKFKAITPSPDKLADFWWHDEFAVENVEIKQANDPQEQGNYVVKFTIEEPFYLPSNDEDDDYVPDNWEPFKMTFMQCEPVPYGLAVRIKDEIIRMTANGYIDAPNVIDGMDMYDLEITYGGISGM